MAPTLYYADVSPPVRSVLLTCKAIDLVPDLKPINLMAGEQLSAEFVKLNPQHTVPTLDDDGFILWDSHAINAYLVGKYAKDDSLYPKDLQKRATIDQRLHFESSIMFPRGSSIIGPIIREGVKTVPKDKADAVIKAYALLEAFLENSQFVAGDNLSIADMSLISGISTINVLVPIAANRFPHISRWMTRMEALPYYKEANQVGLDKIAGFLKSKLA